MRTIPARLSSNEARGAEELPEAVCAEFGMYAGKSFNGKTIAEWSEILHHEYSLGEIYRMAMGQMLSGVEKSRNASFQVTSALI